MFAFIIALIVCLIAVLLGLALGAYMNRQDDKVRAANGGYLVPRRS